MMATKSRPAKARPEPSAIPLDGESSVNQAAAPKALSPRKSSRPAKESSEPNPAPPDEEAIDWPHLRAVAEEYDALQGYRIAAANRASHLSESVLELNGIAQRTKEIEDDLGKVLERTYRQVVPVEIRAWQKAQAGIGELQMARLLGHLGHPRTATPFHWEGEGKNRVLIQDPPFERGVGQLWAYCGRTGDPERRKRKGMSADDAMKGGKPMLKMLTHLIAESMIKAGIRKLPDAPLEFSIETRVAITPWGEKYMEYRKLHAGFAWTPGHQHNAALHRIAKDMLLGLWVVSGPATVFAAPVVPSRGRAQ